jgi:glycosyltransferase involved in cell wall biosynthesis
MPQSTSVTPHPGGGRDYGSSPLEAGEQSARLLADAARQALGRNDLAGYGTLFARAAAIEHEVARYRARKALTELGRAYSAVLLPGPAQRRARTVVAQGVLGALDAEPAKPLLLGYAGATVGELGALAGAEALLDAARRLDPGVTEMLGPSPSWPQPASAAVSVDESIAALATIASAVAARAQPADDMTISLCMIVRNEQEMLPRCLEAAAPAVDEIVIVDTGSEDGTIEIARSFGARVIEQTWSGDFSVARNVSFEHATCDWILRLDADEELVAEDATRLRALAGEVWHEASYLREIDDSGEQEVGAGTAIPFLRMFRNRPEYRFHGRVHEQIIDTLPQGLPELIGRSTVRVMHYGYRDEVRSAKGKSQRNLELLEAQRRDGDDSAFLHFNLGSEYFALQRYDKCLDQFSLAWRLVLAEGIDRAGFASVLAIKRTRALRAAGQHEQAVAFAGEALEHFPDFTDLVYEQGLSLNELGRDRQATACFEHAIAMGEAPLRYSTYRGCGSYLPRVLLAGRHLERGEADQAVPLLEWCLDHAPGYFYGTVAPYVLALSKAGSSGAQIAAAVHRHLPEPTPRMREALVTALLTVGACSQALDEAEQLADREKVTALQRILPKLLQLQEFEDFGRAERLFMAAEQLPLRERREQLAQIYLSAGYLRSAAREWFAVCQSEPDARALAGLAQVSLTNRQPGPAEQFATAALELEPDNAVAAAVLKAAQT